jgi:hypothetical protein
MDNVYCIQKKKARADLKSTRDELRIFDGVLRRGIYAPTKAYRRRLQVELSIDPRTGHVAGWRWDE